VNNQSKVRFVEYLSELPPFKEMSKVIRKKVIQQSRFTSLPKGWAFDSLA
jgi:hypothetical protein